MEGPDRRGRGCTVVRLASLLLWVTATVGPASAWANAPIRVNAGGPAYVDSAGNLWQADTGYNTGNTASVTSSIAGTSDPSLFQTLRWDPASSPELQYAFNVPNGSYEVRLHFAESHAPTFGVGLRVFSVQIEDVTVHSNLDVYAEVGANTALMKSSVVGVHDGQLVVRFLHGPTENPFVNAIEILKTNTPSAPTALAASAHSSTQINVAWNPAADDVGVTSYYIERCTGTGCTDFSSIAAIPGTAYSDSGLAPATIYRYRVRAVDADNHLSAYSNIVTASTNGTTPPSPIRINVGGSTYVGTDGKNWAADTGYNTGNSFSVANEIAGTSDDPLFQTGRWDAGGTPELQYSLNVPNGSYAVKLYFAETNPPTFAVGTRIFHVQLEGAAALSNLDVYAEAGANTALIKDLTANVADGQLNITLLHGPIENPFINAIEVVATQSSDGQAPSPPTSLAAVVVGPAQVSLSWGPSSDNVGVTMYSIERCLGSGCTTFAEISTSSTTAYTDTAASPSTIYRYRVRAADAANNWSAYSSVVEANTAVFSDAVPPSAPTALSATAVSSSQIELLWGAATDNVGVTEYLIERCQGAQCTDFSQIATRATTSYRDLGRAGATAYRYRVRARDAANNRGAYSAAASATTPINGADCD